MRAALLILILAVIAVIAAIATGLVDIRQTRPAEVPNISTEGNGVSAQGGQTPAFDIETGSVTVGSQERTVTVPTLQVEPAGGNEGSTANAAGE